MTEGNEPIIGNEAYNGLTKREHFAALAMQGMLASGRDNISHIAKTSVFVADAVIVQLNKKKSKS